MGKGRPNHMKGRLFHPFWAAFTYREDGFYCTHWRLSRVTCWYYDTYIRTRNTGEFPSNRLRFQNNALVERQRKSKCQPMGVFRVNVIL